MACIDRRRWAAYSLPMRKHTTIDLDADLVQQAGEVLGSRRTTDTIHAALADVVRRRKRRRAPAQRAPCGSDRGCRGRASRLSSGALRRGLRANRPFDWSAYETRGPHPEHWLRVVSAPVDHRDDLVDPALQRLVVEGR